MNRTELFRDFLITNNAKHKFEVEYALNPNSQAFCKEYPLKWTDDFLTSLMKKAKYVDKDCHQFLSPTWVITWNRLGTAGYIYWSKLNTKWYQFFNKNEYLLDTQGPEMV